MSDDEIQPLPAGIYYSPGDDLPPLALTDTVTMDDVEEYLSELQMRVFFTRLVTWADRVDEWMEAHP